MAAGELGSAHRRRLRDLWRSAGWPCHDALELDLLATGMVTRHWDEAGRETLRVSDAGITWLASSRWRHQAALNAHEALVQCVAQAMQRAGRLVWCGLSLRAALAGEDGATRWPVVMPDVYSIRHTTVEDYVEPIVHEIKVSRADLLSDLRHPTKTAAYVALSGECWYVLRRGIAQPQELPECCGVMLADEAGLEVARPAPQRARRLGFADWMALARAQPLPARDDEQGLLGPAEDHGSGNFA